MPDEPTSTVHNSTDIFKLSGSEPGSASFVPTVADARQRAVPRAAFDTGERFGDFLILKPLGQGGFATVYLALDLQLDRRIALKVSETHGEGEGRVLAELEHEHIVQVYAQFVEPTTKKFCLCLQYVPGATLASVIEKLHAAGVPPRAGKEILDAIVTDPGEVIALDPAGLRNREILSGCDFAAAVCRIGRQLAEALQFAHHRGVLHCDIKPANVLVNPYGRPLLADFNVAIENAPGGPTKARGGTVAYMSPEQLGAMLREPGQAVDGRSDIYSLGALLFELYTGRLPFDPTNEESFQTRLGRLREFRTTIPWEQEKLPPVLERVLRRCLDPDPAKRYPNAEALARALGNAFDLLTIDQALPPGGRPTRWASAAPGAAILAMLMAPHLVATAFNIAFNAIEIRLTPAQMAAFFNVTMGYNSVIYPVAITLMMRQILPVVRGWRTIGTCSTAEGCDVDGVRRASLTLSNWAMVIALAGWLPGGIAWPLGIDFLVGGVSTLVYAQFMLSFTLAGLIALIYSYFGAQFVVLRVIYPRLGDPDTYSRERTAAELARATRWVGAFQVLAGAVPLTGAVLLVLVTGEMTLSFRLLMVSLIVLGMFGVWLAINLTRRLNEVTATLNGQTAGRGGPM